MGARGVLGVGRTSSLRWAADNEGEECPHSPPHPSSHFEAVHPDGVPPSDGREEDEEDEEEEEGKKKTHLEKEFTVRRHDVELTRL